MAQQIKLKYIPRASALVLLLVASTCFAMPIDKQLLINPIQICRSDTVCANTQQLMPQDVMNNVWNQAGIKVEVLPFQSFVDASSYELSITEISRQTFFVENPLPIPPVWFDTTAPSKSSEQQIINLWFIDSFSGGFSNIAGVTDAQETVFDAALWFQNSGRQGSDVEFFNNIAISRSAFQFGESYLGYVLSHEIGHALGLSHCDVDFFTFSDPCPSTGNLMSVQTSGEQLANAQIDLARSSRFLSPTLALPEPATALLVLPFLLAFRRRQKDEHNI